MSKLIFSTVHGSHLYGLAHEGSDLDIYEVYEGKHPRGLRQSTDGVDDRVRGTLDAFLLLASTGSHQSVEAMFSKRKFWMPGMYEKYGAVVDGFRVTGSAVFAKYERTIRKFCFEDHKRRRHACRLSLNLAELRKRGRFDPELSQPEALLCDRFAKELEGEALWERIR